MSLTSSDENIELADSLRKKLICDLHDYVDVRRIPLLTKESFRFVVKFNLSLDRIVRIKRVLEPSPSALIDTLLNKIICNFHFPNFTEGTVQPMLVTIHYPGEIDGITVDVSTGQPEVPLHIENRRF